MLLRSLLFLLIVSTAASAEPLVVVPSGAPEPEGAGTVQSVADGDTLDLEPGGTIRLVGLQAPKLPLGRPGFKAWPLAEEAREALASLVTGHELAIRPGTTPKDRWGRTLAHLERKDGTWIQGEMLRRGWARVYTFPDNRLLAGDMLALEREARAARRGIWALRWYAVRSPESAAGAVDTFQLVEGRVMDAASVRGRVYLNFGPDWKTDFTIVVPPKVRRQFEREGLDPLSLKDRRIRVRGWLKEYNGPMIEVSHPEQIEVLEPLEPESTTADGG
jgi:endonuclease YncB( thermonuclease family)